MIIEMINILKMMTKKLKKLKKNITIRDKHVLFYNEELI